MFKSENLNLGDSYDFVEFTLTNGQTNYNVKTNQTSLFLNIPEAGKCIIESNKNITVRFNNTAFPAVKLDAGESPMELIEKIIIRNIFMTNASGSDATIRVWLMI